MDLPIAHDSLAPIESPTTENLDPSDFALIIVCERVVKLPLSVADILVGQAKFSRAPRPITTSEIWLFLFFVLSNHLGL
jgi:hypothetical protein